MQPSLFVAIDPGASGAYVIRRPDGQLVEIAAYHEAKDVLKLCTYLKANNISVFPIVAVIEQVWASPVMGVSAAFAFGENYGGWCMALRASGIPVYMITPQKWQRVVAPEISGQGADRKRALRDLAQTKFPQHKVTLATADALLLSEYVCETLRAGKVPGELL